MSIEGRVLLPSQLVPSHYVLELTPNFESLTFTCKEEIHVTVREETKEVTLHSREIVVDTVTFENAAGEKVTVEEINYNLKAHTVKFVFGENFSLGEGKLHITYKGILNGDMAGFYKSTYTDVNGNKKIMASTQFEALDARRAFPCWDEPGVKATFAVTLIVPSHLTALSNMPEQSITHVKGENGQMLKKTVFDTSPKMSTYLLAWAVGEFDSVQAKTKNNVVIRVFSPPGRAAQGTFALDVAVRSLDFFDNFFKMPYPLPKLDMICITEFAMGAMENWGLVTYRETALMIDEATASPQTKQRVAIVVAHELAHQWFGNLVTMQWWDGLWLNEGFAAFMEHFCIDELFPDYQIWSQYTTDAFGAAQRLDALKSSHPVIVPIKHAEEVEQVFDAISYCKGSTVVNMVYAVLGKDKFREGLQVYMARHAYGNTETVDLWNCWSEVSGKDVAALMKNWTTVTGYPLLKVVSEEWSDTQVKLTLEQHRFLSDGSALTPEDDCVVWSVPLLFSSEGSASSAAVIMDQQRQTFTVPLVANSAANQWVKINAGQKALARVQHSSAMIGRLVAAVQRDINSLDEIDRAALLLDAYALAKAGVAPLEDVVSILKAFEQESSATVWSAIAGVLNGLHVLIEHLNDNEVFASFMSFGKKLVLKALHKVGWESEKGVTESHTAKLLRATVMSLVDTFACDDADVVAEARRRFNLHWEDAAALPTDYKTQVYRIVLMNGGKAEFDKLMQSFKDTEDNQVRKYVMFSLGAVNDDKLKLQALDWAVKSGDVKLQDFFYPIGSVSGSSLAGSQLTWKYYQDNFALIKEKLSKASPSLMDAVIINSIGRMASADRADEIEKFFVDQPLPSSARRIAQSLENMRASAKMLEAIGRSQLASAAFWA